MEIIKNYDDVLENLKEMLKNFIFECNHYQTDVYAYYDVESHEVELDTFVNVGGRSWLDDNHITVYTDRPHYNDIEDYYQSVEEFADALDIPEEELLKQVKADLIEQGTIDEDDNDYDVNYWEVHDFVKENYHDKMCEAYEEDFGFDEIENTAYEIMENLEKEIKERYYSEE